MAPSKNPSFINAFDDFKVFTSSLRIIGTIGLTGFFNPSRSQNNMAFLSGFLWRVRLALIIFKDAMEAASADGGNPVV